MPADSNTQNTSLFSRGMTIFRQALRSPIAHAITLGNTFGVLSYGLNTFRNHSLYDSFIGEFGGQATNFGTTLAITLGVLVASHQYTIRNRPLTQPDLLDQIGNIATTLDTYNIDSIYDTTTTERTFTIDSSDDNLEEVNKWMEDILTSGDYDEVDFEFVVRRVENNTPDDVEANIGRRSNSA